MEKTIMLLASIAEQLDSQGLVSLASRVDSVTNNALGIKTAQYVGIQGYAIRNSRCWGNCYRKKRMDSPTKSAQVVWTECHKEYVESINNDGSKWDKYADSNDSFVKVASVPQSKYLEIDKQISKIIDEKVSAGLDLGNAIFASVEDVSNATEDQAVSSSNELLNIASEIVSDPEMANKIAEAANSLIKEAGFFDGIGRAVGNRWQSFNVDRNIGSNLGDMDSAVASAINSFKKLHDSKQKLTKYLTSIKPRTQQQKQVIDNAIQGMFDLDRSFDSNKINQIKTKWETIKQTINLGTGVSQQPQATQMPQNQTAVQPQASQQYYTGNNPQPQVNLPNGIAGPNSGFGNSNMTGTYSYGKNNLKLADIENYYSGFEGKKDEQPKAVDKKTEVKEQKPKVVDKKPELKEQKPVVNVGEQKTNNLPLPKTRIVQMEINSIDPSLFFATYKDVKNGMMNTSRVSKLSKETKEYLSSIKDFEIFKKIAEWQKRRWEAEHKRYNPKSKKV